VAPAARPARPAAETNPVGVRRSRTAARHTPAGGLGAVSGRLEREQLVTALEECDGNKAEAARRLGIPRSTLVSKLQKYALM
jgi:DNA-binding NtrC family response regulator